jgi:protein-tyrosine phosphatase
MSTENPKLGLASESLVSDGPRSAEADLRPGLSLGVASVPNLRDLGGYVAANGRTIRRGMLFRSNQLNPVSDADLARLAALHLKSDFDLRTAAERNARPDQLPAGVRNIWLDVLADADQSGPAQLLSLLQDPQAANAQMGGGKVEALFGAAYRDIVSLPSARRAYRTLFLALAEDENLPALFHCTTGKDRTGWAAVAFLSLMGVEKDVVIHDYLQSNQYILPAYKPQIDAFVKAGGDADIPQAILGVRPSYLDVAFDEVASRYGTIEGYFSEALGVDAALQKRLIEKFTQPD